MAKRLIDVSKLTKPPYAAEDNIVGAGMSYDEQCGYNDGIDTVWSMIQHYTPTVDAVEVVRCRDCKWDKPDKLLCKHWCTRFVGCMEMREDDFCSYGERKEG